MIICLIGASSSGKSTIEGKLSEMGFPKIISYTTRPMRDGEKNGVDYNFIDEQTFLELEQEGRFQETARYRDWYYGISLEGVDYKNKDYVVVATVGGYKELLKVVEKDYIIAIHIKVNERERIKRQLERGDDLDEIFRRIKNDRVDFDGVEDICDYVVENDRVDNSLVKCYNIIRKHSNAK